MTWFCSALLLAVICGCGVDRPDITSTQPADHDDGDRAVAADDAPRAVRTNKTEPKPDKPAGREANAALASADPNDVFAVVEDDANFVIVEEGDATFYAMRPPAGVDATQFTVILPQSEQKPAVKANPRFRLPEGFVALPETGYSDEGLPLRIACQVDGSVMALIPASFSLQGTNNGFSEARPQFSIYLDPYYIDVAEVTLGRFERFRTWSREAKKRAVPPPRNVSSPKTHPALGISWADARMYATWAGKELPTEAEWEKAARGPDGLLHPWGNGRPAWSPPRTRTQIDPVMSFRTDVSPYGVYDLAGNAREWCADYYSAEAYQEAANYGATGLRNWTGPKRPSVDNCRVVKGNGPGWMLWHRWPVHMRESDDDVGFRCVLRGVLSGEAGAD